MALAALLCGGTLAATGSALTAPPALAQYAEGGSGLYRTSIDWFEWGAADAPIPAGGLTRTNTRTVAGAELATTCVLSDIQGSFQAYRSGTWAGDALDDLYNVGGTGLDNQLVTGIANRDQGASGSFRFSCSATLDGVAVPLQGLVVADAEASNPAVGSFQTEYMQARPEQPATWRIIDRYRSDGCTTSTQAVRSADGTLRFTPDGRECHVTDGSWRGPMAVGFMEGATSAQVALQGGGNSAVALGVVLQTDFGDAPASYGEAGALFEPTWQGGTVPVGTVPVSGPGFALASQAQPNTRLGAVVDAENGYQPSADATGDDDAGSADEDAIDPPGTVVVTPGEAYTLEDVRCTGPGYVAGWLDWDHDGTFGPDERSAVVPCSAASVDLTWTVPDDAVAALDDDRTFLRLRIAADDVAVSSPTGMTTSGEVEDYALNVALPRLAVTKVSDATADTRPGDTVTYTVTATNTGEGDYTTGFPAVVVDDLSDLLDDAVYGADAAADRPGTLSYVSPLLSWRGALPSGESVRLTYTVTMKSGGDGVARNVAWAPADPDDPEPPACDPPLDGTDPGTGEPCAPTEHLLPRLTITKTADRTELPAVGETVEYAVTVTNEGPGVYTAQAPATFADDLSDVLDAATFGDDATASTGTVSYDEPVLSWQGALGVDESATVTYTVAYTATGDQNLRNLACVPQPEVLPGASACGFVQIPGAGLTRWKQVRASDTPAVAGTVLTYTLFFANDGQTAADVDAVDDLSQVIDDADVTAEPSSTDGLTVVRTGDRIAINGSVPVGATSTVSYQVTVRPDGERGDDIATNFLLDPDDDPPTGPACDPVDARLPECTATPVAAVVYRKSVSADTAPVGAGTVLTYTVTVENTGAATAPVSREDVLTDVLDDAELTVAPASDTASVTVSTVSDGRFRIGGELAAGRTATVTYQVTVSADAARGNNLADNFLVPPGTTPPDECLAGSDQCTSTPVPLITATKSADPVSGTAVTAGQEITYTLTFRNTGEAAGPVEHVDDLADVLDDATLTAGPTVSDPVLVVSRTGDRLHVAGTLVPDQTVTVTYTVTVGADGERGDNLVGNLLARSDRPDPRCGDVDVSCTDHPVPQLRSWKDVEADSTPVVAGTVLTYRLFFENLGRAPATVDAVDDLAHVTDDADVTAEPSSADGLTVVRAGDRITVTGQVPPDRTFVVTYQVTVRPDGERGDGLAVNVLLPAGQDPPTDPVCRPADEAYPDCTATPVGWLVASKSVAADTDPVDVGTVLTYTLMFENRGQGSVDVDRTDVLTDVLDDAHLTRSPVSSDDALEVSEVADGMFTVEGVLAAGQTATVTYQVTVTADGAGDGSADNFLVPTGEDPPTGCVADDPTCTVTPLPQVRVDKSADPASGSAVQAGQVVAYTLTFTNTGRAAGRVDHTDDLTGVIDDAELTGAPVSSDPALAVTADGGDAVRVTGTLRPDQTVTVSYSVTVRPDGRRGDDRLRNVVARTGTADPRCGSVGVVCTEHAVGGLDDWKTADPAAGTALRAGQPVTYTLHLENTGEAPVPVDRDDVLTGVLDDADLTALPVASSDALTVSAVREGRITITGELSPGEQATVTYTVTVRTDGRGDGRLDNFLVPGGDEAPSACTPTEDEHPDCTTHPVVVRTAGTVPPQGALSDTGSGAAPALLGIALLLLGTGSGLLLAHRRRAG